MLQKVKQQGQLRERVQRHLDAIYHQNPLGANFEGLADELLELMDLDDSMESPEQYINHCNNCLLSSPVRQ